VLGGPRSARFRNGYLSGRRCFCRSAPMSGAKLRAGRLQTGVLRQRRRLACAVIAAGTAGALRQPLARRERLMNVFYYAPSVTVCCWHTQWHTKNVSLCALRVDEDQLLKLISPLQPEEHGVCGEDDQWHLPNGLRRDFSRLLFPASSLPTLRSCPKAWWLSRPKATYWSSWWTRLLVPRRSGRTLLLLRETESCTS
jgi:hypothetical protein